MEGLVDTPSVATVAAEERPTFDLKLQVAKEFLNAEQADSTVGAK